MADDWITPSAPTSGQDDWVTPGAGGSQLSASASPSSGGIAKNFGAGFEEGVTGLAGTIANAVNPVPHIKRDYSAVTGGNYAPADQAHDASAAGDTVTHYLNKGLGLTGLNPEDVQANTAGEKIARMAGTGATAALAPEAEAPEIADGLGTVGSKVVPRFANSPIAMTARKAVTGMMAGAGSGLAQQAVPDDDPILKQSVGILGAIAGGAVAEAPALVRGAARGVRQFAKPMTAAGQDQMAADTLRSAATDPTALDKLLDPANGEIVHGSQPTTFQQTGDMGLGGLERGVAAKNPVVFNQRRADQNEARLAALGDVQPTVGLTGTAAGDPADVGSFLRNQFGQFDAQTQQHIDELAAKAQQQTEALGGSGNPEDHGTAIRAALQDAETAARAREGGLWRAVDPDRNLMLSAQPTADAAADIAGGMSPSAKPMEGEEAAIFNVAQGYGPQTPLADIADLRSRTSAAMRQELTTNGRTPAYARLTRLRGAIQNNLADAATNQASQDAVNVASGAATPAQTVTGKLQSWVNDFYGKRAAQPGETSATGDGQGAVARAPASAGPDGTGFSPEGGFSGSAGAPGVPSQPFDQAAADRLAAATQATKDRAQTFGAGPAKQVLAKAGSQDAFRLPEARVPEKYFHAGPTSFQDIQGLRQTVGDDAALPILQDYAASSLRKAAESPDGTLIPAKVQAWQTKYGRALRAFPQLNERFTSAAGMSEAIADSAADRLAAIKDRNATAVGKVMNAPDADAATRTVGGIFGKPNAAQAMQDLAQAASRSPEAQQGLRQAVADHITKNFVSNTEAGTSGLGLIKSDQFQSFVKANRAALSQVFSPEEMGVLDSIAADLRRANRSITAAKLPGGSNTAQDMHAVIANDPNSTVLDHAISEAGAAGAGAVAGHLPGAFLGAMSAKVANAFRASGLKKVDDLVTEAMLNPGLARDLLRKAPAQADSGQSVALASRLRRIAVSAAATRLGAPQKGQPQPSAYRCGGKVAA